MSDADPLSYFSLNMTSLNIPDNVIGPFWLIVNVLLWLAAWRLGRRLFPQDAVLTCIAHTLVLCWACIVAVAVVLGLTGWLTDIVLLIAIGCVSAAALLVLRSMSARLEPAQITQQPTRTEIAWLLVWGLLLAFWIGHVITAGLLRFPTDWDSIQGQRALWAILLK